jgi:hypothetical protein
MWVFEHERYKITVPSARCLLVRSRVCHIGKYEHGFFASGDASGPKFWASRVYEVCEGMVRTRVRLPLLTYALRSAHRMSVPAMLPFVLVSQGAIAQDVPLSQPAQAVTWEKPTLGFYGAPGILDMPSGNMMPDGEVSLSASYFRGILRNNLTFQIMPWISGSFRYSILDNYDFGGTTNRYDRSFDLRFQLREEDDVWPAVAVGLRDFGGTGVYSSEFVAASKTLDRWRLTGGIGWGRLASKGGFSNPLGLVADSLKTRSATGMLADTGQLNFGEWFHGDTALFGGAQYQYNDHLVFSAEYSSDAYAQESKRIGLKQNIPFNFGATYRFRNGYDVTFSYMYGTDVGLMFSHTFDPKQPKYPGGLEASGVPVLPRDQAAALGWGRDVVSDRQARTSMIDRVRAGLAAEGLVLVALDVDAPDHVTIHIGNPRFNAKPEAIGRAARVLTNTLPPAIETMTIVPQGNGMPLSAVTVQRSDLEELEYSFDGSWKMYSRARIEEGTDYPLRDTSLVPGAYPQFDFALDSYVSPSYFDPDQPIRIDAGPQLDISYTPAPGLILSSRLRYPMINQRSDVTRLSNSVLPHVRSDAPLYDQAATGIQMHHLTSEYFFRPGDELFGRFTTGYLEQMYAGISGEVLWKPVTGPLSLGAELNYVVQRDFDGGFGLRDYNIVTGHASAYYNFGDGYLGQIDAGRYLAGDWGATFSFDREFANGFRIGAFFTLTDVSFDDFGEGSFDKGFRFFIPLSRVSGEPSQSGFGQTVRLLTRDGGARLNIRNRLYETVRSYHDPELRDDWGKFWR